MSLQQILHLISREGAGSPQLVLKRTMSHNKLVCEGKDLIPRCLPRVGKPTKAALRQVEGKVGNGICRESTKDRKKLVL